MKKRILSLLMALCLLAAAAPLGARAMVSPPRYVEFHTNYPDGTDQTLTLDIEHSPYGTRMELDEMVWTDADGEWVEIDRITNIGDTDYFLIGYRTVPNPEDSATAKPEMYYANSLMTHLSDTPEKPTVLYAQWMALEEPWVVLCSYQGPEEENCYTVLNGIDGIFTVPSDKYAEVNARSRISGKPVQLWRERLDFPIGADGDIVLLPGVTYSAAFAGRTYIAEYGDTYLTYHYLDRSGVPDVWDGAFFWEDEIIPENPLKRTDSGSGAKRGTLKGWSLSEDGSGELYFEGNLVRDIPQGVHDLYAVYEGGTWTVSFYPNGGNGSMPAVEAPKDQPYILPECGFTPPEGMVFDRWNVGAAGEALTLSGNTVIEAVWMDAPAPENPFEDITEDDYYADAVHWAYSAQPQVTTGMDDTHFGPRATVTRGQAVTFLWRAMGCPEPASMENPFEDVAENQYYFKAVLWAVEQGITKGTDDTHFSPNQVCSTAHILTFLYRTLGIGADGWYQVAEAWAQGAGLLDGLDLTVAPGVDCLRCDVVYFLFRALEK